MIFSYILIIIAVVLEPLMEKNFLPGILVFAQLIFVAYFHILKNKKVSKLFFYFGGYLTLVMIITVVNNPPSYYGYGLRIMTYFMQLVIGTQFFCFILENQKEREKLIKVFIVTMLFLSAYVIFEGITQKNPIFVNLFREKWQVKSIYGYGRGYRAAGSMESPLVMSFPIILALFISYFKLRVHKELKYILPLAIFLVSSYFLRARTVLILVAMIILSIEALNITKNKLFMNGIKTYLKNTKIYLMCIVILFLFIKYSGVIYEVFTSNTMSYIHRLSSIKFALVEFFEGNIFQILLGRGFGSLAYKVLSEEITITDAGFYAIDNEIVTILFEFGIVGITLLMAMIFYHLKNIREESSEVIFLNIAMIIFIVFYMMIFNILHWYSLTVIISVILAYLISVNKKGDFKI